MWNGALIPQGMYLEQKKPQENKNQAIQIKIKFWF